MCNEKTNQKYHIFALIKTRILIPGGWMLMQRNFFCVCLFNYRGITMLSAFVALSNKIPFEFQGVTQIKCRNGQGVWIFMQGVVAVELINQQVATSGLFY